LTFIAAFITANMLDFDALKRARIAHGVLMSLAVILFFPIGGILVRVLRNPMTVKLHILCQLLGLSVLVAGFGLGLWFQKQVGIVRSSHASRSS
jgi:hypothetical protein